MTGRVSRALGGHRVRWIVAAVVVVGLVVAGFIGGRSHQDGGGVHVGDRFDGVTVFSGQTKQSERMGLPMPFGFLSLTVGTGTEVGEQEHRVRAPEGATMVEVSWSPGTTFEGPVVWAGASARERRDPGADLTLITGGRRYPIATSVTTADEGASAVVAVQGDGSDARVEARVAGRTIRASTEVLTPRGPGRGVAPDCDDSEDKTYAWVVCRLPMYRNYYVAGLGTAPAGKEWLVVSAANVTRKHHEVHLYGDGENRAEYVPTGVPKASVTVDGVTSKPRVAGTDTAIGDSVYLADRAWLVDADRSATVRLRYRQTTKLDRPESRWPGAPSTYEVRASTNIAYPAA